MKKKHRPPNALRLIDPGVREMLATMKQLARYWEKARQQGDPKTSPTIEALAEILFMGRQVRLHIRRVAQSAPPARWADRRCARTSPPASSSTTPSGRRRQARL
ncbi:hypothetical protein [Streptomyces sp. NPDC000880]